MIQWLLDSGANKHLLTNYQEFDVPETVRLDGGHTVEAYGSGQVNIALKINKKRICLLFWTKCSLFQSWLAPCLVSEL